uniref:Major facilitator superfamily (MFS) profile domain-containing protein n=1 Tax=Aotus nancymaae TaxID=37293 RepID=A0A2K5CZS5_AOTNA
MGTQKVTPALIFAITVATIGSFQFGYNTGVINAPEMIIKEFVNNTLKNKKNAPPSEMLLTSLWSLSVAIFSVGGMIGSFSVGLFVNRFVTGFCSPARATPRIRVAIRRSDFTQSHKGKPPVTASSSELYGIFGLEFILGSEVLWPVLLGFTIVPAILQSAALPFCPESPRFLLINRKEEENAKQSEYPLRIFKDAGVQEPIYATIGAGVVNTIFTVVSVSHAVFTFHFLCSFLLQDNYNGMSFVCIGAILVFVAFFEIGPGPIPWFIVAELFSQGPRPAAMAVAGCSNWTSNFLVGLLFPSAA